MENPSSPGKRSQVSAGSSELDPTDRAERDNERKKSKTTKSGRIAKSLESIRRTRAGRIGLKLGVGFVGFIVVAGGLVLVPLPGPGWLIVFAGIAIWSIEFSWAKRLNRYVRYQVATWTAWYARQRWPMRIVLGALLTILVVAIIAGATYLSLGSAPFHWIGL